jgi:hypothetical protein
MERSYSRTSSNAKQGKSTKSGYICTMCNIDISVKDSEDNMKSCQCCNVYCKICSRLLEKINDFYMHRLYCPCFYIKPYFNDNDIKIKCSDLRYKNLETIKMAIINNKNNKACNIESDYYSSEEEDRWDMRRSKLF